MHTVGQIFCGGSEGEEGLTHLPILDFCTREFLNKLDMAVEVSHGAFRD